MSEETSDPPVIVGIDLGTTHCALARAEVGPDGKGHVETVDVLQLTNAQAVESRGLLPSFYYVAGDSEPALTLPWDNERRFAVGEYARTRGIEAPGRLVSSAKSWLCHAGIDRRSGVLPQTAEPGLEKISPVEASYRYLEHLTEAFAHARGGEALAEAEIILTVPASFDAGARELTVEAAGAAGFENLTLLEEPQAALYAWIASRGDAFRKELSVGDVILVVDVGGGTTDFSLIAVEDDGGTFQLSRLAVGDHILLGGDNMDLALAHLARQKLTAAGKEVDRMQMVALTHAARAAKERLLADPALASAPIAVASAGSALVGGTLRTTVEQAEIERSLIDGFFPEVAADAKPVKRPRVGLVTLGLPYADDPAVTRHLAAFLAKQRGARGDASAAMLHPTVVLFNGGVMKSARLRERVLSLLGAWAAADGRPAPRALSGADLDHAVAVGAAHYGLVRRGAGLRIRGGTARAYYVGIESSAPAVPGLEPPLTALCVAPLGMEEGSKAALPEIELGVVVGESVRFRFFGSTTRRADVAGTTLEDVTQADLDELPPIEITLPAEGRAHGDVVPVHLEASVTEVGTLLFEAVPTEPRKRDERFKIELSVRDENHAG
jgi:hypothetical protein